MIYPNKLETNAVIIAAEEPKPVLFTSFIRQFAEQNSGIA